MLMFSSLGMDTSRVASDGVAPEPMMAWQMPPAASAPVAWQTPATAYSKTGTEATRRPTSQVDPAVAAADAQRAQAAAAEAQAVADAAATNARISASRQAQAEAQRAQEFADAVAVAARQAADEAVAAYAATHGMSPSPGMQIVDTESNRPIITPIIEPPPKKIPWLLIGLGVLGAVGIGALIARR